MRILIVEDSRERRVLLGKIYSRHEVSTATTSTEAIAYLKDRQFDIIHLDYDLDDGTNGGEVSSYLAANGNDALVIVHSENRLGVEAIKNDLPKVVTAPISEFRRFKRLRSRMMKLMSDPTLEDTGPIRELLESA